MPEVMSTIRAPLTESPGPTMRPLTIASWRSGENRIVPSTASNGTGISALPVAGCAGRLAPAPPSTLPRAGAVTADGDGVTGCGATGVVTGVGDETAAVAGGTAAGAGVVTRAVDGVMAGGGVTRMTGGGATAGGARWMKGGVAGGGVTGAERATGTGVATGGNTGASALVAAIAGPAAIGAGWTNAGVGAGTFGVAGPVATLRAGAGDVTDGVAAGVLLATCCGGGACHQALC